MASYYRELKRLLTEAGCKMIRQGNGSHEIWFSPKTNANFTVPYDCQKRHTANGILKSAGLDKAF